VSVAQDNSSAANPSPLRESLNGIGNGGLWIREKAQLSGKDTGSRSFECQ